MRTQITPYDFEQLKYFFDQNDSSGGATHLEELLKSYIQDSYKVEYNGEQLYHIPFEVGGGLAMMHNPNNSYDKPMICLETEPGISLDPELLKSIEQMVQHTTDLEQRVLELEAMHNTMSDIPHVPCIISRKEQYEAMKEEVDAEERVLVSTTFDKAMSVL